MSNEFKLPELGENITSAVVSKVLIKAGDTVKEDQSVIEIETDKATIEVPSSVSGKVKEVFAKEGGQLNIGAVVFSLEGEAQSAPAVEETKETPVSETPAPAKTETKAPVATSTEAPKVTGGIKDVLLPELGENITSAIVSKVLFKVGDVIAIDTPLLEIETDKATIEVPSTVSGKVVEILVKDGGKADVGKAFMKIQGDDTVKSAPAPVQSTKPAAQVSEPVVVDTPVESKYVRTTMDELVVMNEELKSPVMTAEPPRAFMEMQPPLQSKSAPAAPSVRRLARELGVDINQVPGSGIGGRISIEDIKAYVKKLNEGRITLSPSSYPQSGFVNIKQEALPDFSKFGEIERKAMSNIRSKTAEHLSYAWATVPHVTQFDKADITNIEEMRKTFAPVVQKAGGKLTMTSILVKVVTAALKQFPQFNASVDMGKKEIVYKKYFNIGIAVDTEYGLMVPVLKNTDKMNLTQISVEINNLSEKARNKKAGIDDLQGGCFSISNLGGIGGTYFTPIVNTPEVAILGVSRSQLEPVYIDGNFVPRNMLPLSLSYDHRLVDGADAIRFLRFISETLENPFKLLVEG
ncbi:MAG: dihydrolipoyllysine-residue acetyltransferase [Ignavibacteriaceae bacterium]|nr:dihydrolipoyllysine-residue acetyltransferase [Ignavibacteriaceae bacterium]